MIFLSLCNITDIFPSIKLFSACQSSVPNGTGNILSSKPEEKREEKKKKRKREKSKEFRNRMLIIPKVINLPLVASYKFFAVAGLTAREAGMFPDNQQLLRDLGHGM